MPVLAISPGATTDVPASNTTGTTPPSTAGAQWEWFDLKLRVVVGTDITPNGWGIAHDGSGGYSETVPASAPQGGDPDGTGRYEYRLSPSFVAGGP